MKGGVEICQSMESVAVNCMNLMNLIFGSKRLLVTYRASGTEKTVSLLSVAVSCGMVG